MNNLPNFGRAIVAAQEQLSASLKARQSTFEALRLRSTMPATLPPSAAQAFADVRVQRLASSVGAGKMFEAAILLNPSLGATVQEFISAQQAVREKLIKHIAALRVDPKSLPPIEPFHIDWSILNARVEPPQVWPYRKRRKK